MHLQIVVSYGNAWNTLKERFPREHDEIMEAIERLTPESIAAAKPIGPTAFMRRPGINSYRLDGCWAASLRGMGWEQADAHNRSAKPRSISMSALGYRKNHLSVALCHHRDSINRWLYTLAPIAIRKGLIDLPICAALTYRATAELYDRPLLNHFAIERVKDELLALSPLSHSNPFLLLGISMKDQQLEITELDAENDAITRHVVVNRSIEFPPEYHQAGLGILSYFGTVLREKYATHNATVRIEQEGLLVRLIVQSENGSREVIERALAEYELVVRGETDPETFFDNKARVLELKNELRIAQVRIESQKDLIAYQGEEIASLRQLMGHSLTSSQDHRVCVTVNPAITVNTGCIAQVQESLPQLSQDVQELARLAANHPEVELRLLDLEEAVHGLYAKQTPQAVRESGGMKKLKKWLDDAGATGSAANKFLQAINEGVELAQKIARRYNAIAEWCGAPQVPGILLGDEA